MDGDSASVLLHPGDGAPHHPPDGPPFDGSVGSLADGDQLSLGSGYPAVDDAAHETDALLLAPAVAARAPESPPSGLLLGSGTAGGGEDSLQGVAAAAGAAAGAVEDSAVHPPVSMDILTTDRDGLDDLGAWLRFAQWPRAYHSRLPMMLRPLSLHARLTMQTRSGGR